MTMTVHLNFKFSLITVAVCGKRKSYEPFKWPSYISENPVQAPVGQLDCPAPCNPCIRFVGATCIYRAPVAAVIDSGREPVQALPAAKIAYSRPGATYIKREFKKSKAPAAVMAAPVHEFAAPAYLSYDPYAHVKPSVAHSPFLQQEGR